jgi:RNA polymerase sigma factor (TIGR02999 family)
MDSVPSSHDVTRLLAEWQHGRDGALDELLPIIYQPLKRLASLHLRGERRGHSLQPTALINELYLLLVRQRAGAGNNRAHFFALAGQLMRRILVDHARSRHAAKRGRDAVVVCLDDDGGGHGGDEPNRLVEVLEVDRALSKLAALDAVQARIVELRFFAGLTVEETALVVAQSPRTVKREWRAARAWLYRELCGSG